MKAKTKQKKYEEMLSKIRDLIRSIAYNSMAMIMMKNR